MAGRATQVRNVIFYVLVAMFAVLGVALAHLTELPFLAIGLLAIAFGLLGLILAVLTARLREGRAQKTFFILTGVAAAGIPICAVLHNLVYALFIVLFGRGFWDRQPPGGDEPVFFILAVLVCPALFLIGAVGSIVLRIKARRARRARAPEAGASPDADPPSR